MSKRVELSGRTIVVTGAASGMGRTIAQRLARQGCALAICDHDEHGLAETAATLGDRVLQRKIDVRDRQAMFAFAADIKDWMPAPIGAVFNNAGVTTGQTIAQSSPEDDEWVMHINFGGVVNGTHAFLPILLEQDSGAIVNTSSIFGLGAFPSQSAYCASKFAVRGFTESLRHELRETGVSAVTIHPGGVKTNIVRNARWHHDHHGESDHEKMISRFDTLVQTSAEKAAKIIVTGVERGKQRILVGPDAYAYDFLIRVAPVRWYGVLARLEPMIMRD